MAENQNATKEEKMNLYYNYRRTLFSYVEAIDLLKSLFAIGAAYAIAQAGLNFFSSKFIFYLIISIFTVGIGFLLHELAHKITAQKFGCWAEFRADNKMLIFTIILSFIGVLFAAPGAVLISGQITRKEKGIISAAGPATNIVLALGFLLIGLVFPFGMLKTTSIIGASINSWLALFNMIPFGMFDGAKVISWNKGAYTFMTITAAAMLLGASII